jgi:hypothetical protein
MNDDIHAAARSGPLKALRARFRARLVDIAVETYPIEYASGSGPQKAEWRRRIIERSEKEFGNPLLIWLATWAAGILIEKLIEWIISRRENQHWIEGYAHAPKG